METYQNNPYMPFADVTPEEWAFLQQATAELNENQKKYFYMVYSSKRKKAQDILILTIIGFFGFAGIQRFSMGQVAMGLLYLFTLGFCYIGTIVDIVNNKNLTDEYNRQMAYESFQMAKFSAQ